MSNSGNTKETNNTTENVKETSFDPNPSMICVYESIPAELMHSFRMMIPCTHNASGAWLTDKRYWTIKVDEESLNDDKKVYYLKNVWWLDFKCSNKIRNGIYACFWRVKLNNVSWKGNWKVGIDSGAFDQSDPIHPDSNSNEQYTKNTNVIHYAHKRNHGILSNHTGKFHYVYFGQLTLDNENGINNLQFSLTQNNYTTRISFDCIELFDLSNDIHAKISLWSQMLNIPESIIKLFLDFSGYFVSFYAK
eukprot:166041_1